VRPPRPVLSRVVLRPERRSMTAKLRSVAVQVTGRVRSLAVQVTGRSGHWPRPETSAAIAASWTPGVNERGPPIASTLKRSLLPTIFR